MLQYLGLKGGDEPVKIAGTGVGSGFAGGGLLGGRGTGTSDSNLAWVSRGEHIMPARAVQQPGVLAFLEALRRSGGDLQPGARRHGPVCARRHGPAMPAFAAGGLAGGMNHVTIQFPGMPAIGGLRASSRCGRSIAQGGGAGAGPLRWPQAKPVYLMAHPPYTLLAIDDIDFQPICRARHHHDAGADRSGRRTWRAIAAATLADISVAQFRQYKVTITCTDHEAPELTDIWPGQDITITCIPGLGAANRPATC